MKLQEDRIILGIDPGTTIMGYGIIHVKDRTIRLVVLDVVYLSKLADHPLKLRRIFEKTTMLADEHKPDQIAIEAPFYGKNVQSMLKLGRAQGVAIAAALQRNIPVFEYSPRKIKQSITGNGNASKEQVASMLSRLLNFSEMPRHLDATDGLAAAVCHYFQKTPVGGKKSWSGWKGYLAENPEKRG